MFWNAQLVLASSKVFMLLSWPLYLVRPMTGGGRVGVTPSSSTLARPQLPPFSSVLRSWAPEFRPTVCFNQTIPPSIAWNSPPRFSSKPIWVIYEAKFISPSFFPFSFSLLVKIFSFGRNLECYWDSLLQGCHVHGWPRLGLSQRWWNHRRFARCWTWCYREA